MQSWDTLLTRLPQIKLTFFRENHHFEFLIKTAILELLNARYGNHRPRIWPADSSTRQESYSITITLMENIPHTNSRDIKILAPDIDSNVLSYGWQWIHEEEDASEFHQIRLKL